MIERLVYYKTMDSIGSLREAFDFQKEALRIPLDSLAALVPMEVERLLPESIRGISVFKNDDIQPFYTFSNKDSFFIRNNQGFEKVNSTEGIPYKDLFVLTKAMIEKASTPESLLEVQEKFKAKGLYFSPSIDDSFYLRRGNKFKLINVLPSSLENVYVLRASSLKNASTPRKFYQVFGHNASLGRSHKALLRLVGARSLSLWLEAIGLHDLFTDFRIPSIEQLIPTLSKENWLRYKIVKQQNEILNQVKNLVGSIVYVPEVEIEEHDYNFEIVKLLTSDLKPLIDLISEFYEYDRDCFYKIKVEREHLLLIKGIDHKFIPYYEQKFRPDFE